MQIANEPGGNRCIGGFAKVQVLQAGHWAHAAHVVRTGSPAMSETNDVADLPFVEDLVTAIAPMAVPVAKLAADVLGLAEVGDVAILDVGGAQASTPPWGDLGIADPRVHERVFVDGAGRIQGQKGNGAPNVAARLRTLSDNQSDRRVEVAR